jgi:hypothetical protein
MHILATMPCAKLRLLIRPGLLTCSWEVLHVLAVRKTICEQDNYKFIAHKVTPIWSSQTSTDTGAEQYNQTREPDMHLAPFYRINLTRHVKRWGYTNNALIYTTYSDLIRLTWIWNWDAQRRKPKKLCYLDMLRNWHWIVRLQLSW